MLLRWLIASGLSMVMVSPASAGQATCSNPGVPVGSVVSSDLMPGRLSLSVNATMLPIESDEVLDDSGRPVLYQSELLLVDTRIAAEYVLQPWLAIGIAVPYRVIDVDTVQRDPATGEPLPTHSLTHLRTETLRGIGDPSLGAHFARELGRIRVHARVGTSIPLGSTVEDPFLLGSIGQEHQHVQLGTGTFVPFVALEAQRSFGRFTTAVWGLSHLSLYENDNGFRPSRRFSGGLAGSSALGRWTVSVLAEAHGETAERWHGKVYETESNAGRVDMMAGLALSWRPVDGLAVLADARLPVYSRISGSQLDYGFMAGVGVVATFDLKRPPSWRGLDHSSVGRAGDAHELAPVAGRVTVFDLWAAWCAPCRELDALLHDLARAHPDRLAIRKLDVVDADSPSWQRHLAPGQFELPHVKVYGPDGVLRFERTGSPAELARAIEEVLRR